MLSRRGVRIKVMKMLYAKSRDESCSLRQTKSAYNQSISDTYELYLLCMYAMGKICRVATEDDVNRKAKYLPSALDKKFTPRLYENDIIQYIDNHPYLRKKVETYSFHESITKDFAKKIYSDFSKEELYILYLEKDVSAENDLEILLELFRFCRRSEYFNDVMEDAYVSWDDDKSLVVGSVKKTLKALPIEGNVFENHLPDSEIVNDFGMELLGLSIEEDEELLDYIKPILDNWSSERVAIIDMIVIKMALIEFMNFETIPVKVTLNEYVEIAKIYSTPKSKEFVNGILDKLMKQLQADNKVVKEGRGLLD